MPTFPQNELFTHYTMMKQTKKLPVDYSSSKKFYKEYSKDVKAESCTEIATLSFMSIITWLAFIALLLSMARFFWKKADK